MNFSGFGADFSRLNAEQRAIVHLPDWQSAALIGPAGTGKTVALKACMVEWLRSEKFKPAELLLITHDRASATRLRDEIVLALNAPVPGPMARSLTSVAFEIVNSVSIAEGKGPVVLLTGAEQDSIFQRLIEEELADGAETLHGAEAPDDSETPAEAKTPGEVVNDGWPELLSAPVRELFGFRTELRDLWLRAVELGIDPTADLVQNATDRYRETWAAAERFFARYQNFLVEQEISAKDSAQIIDEAVKILNQDRLNPGHRLAKLHTIFVDDGQETSHAGMRLLQAFVNRGVRLIVAGNPDQMTSRFSGAIPDFVGRLNQYITFPETPPAIRGVSPESLEATPEESASSVKTFAFTKQLRFNGLQQHVVRRLVERIGTAGSIEQRNFDPTLDEEQVPNDIDPNHSGSNHPEPAPETPPVSSPSVHIQLAGSQHSEYLLIAQYLRQQFFAAENPTYWNEMAIVVRSRSQIPELVRELGFLGVPARFGIAQEPLRANPVARGLLQMASIVYGTEKLDIRNLTEIMLSPIAGLDSSELRNMRRMILFELLSDTGEQHVDETLLSCVEDPAEFDFLPPTTGLLKFKKLVENLKQADPGQQTVEEILWGFWQRSGLAKTLLTQSRGAGVTARNASEALDAAVALFTLAAREVEREGNATGQEFVAHLLATDLPEDNLAPKYQAPAVTVSTPNATLGAEYDRVVIAGLQEGVWPNPRIRDSLLGASTLVETVMSGKKLNVTQRRDEVIQDELRMFIQSLTRAKTEILMTAVVGDDTGTSEFLSTLIDIVPNNPLADEDPQIFAEQDISLLSIRKMVGQARQELVRVFGTLKSIAESGESTETKVKLAEKQERKALEQVAILHQFAQHDIPGADPKTWYGLTAEHSEKPLFDEEETIYLSPSTLEKFHENAIAWVIDYLGGSAPNISSSRGTILHKYFADVAEGADPEKAEEEAVAEFSRLNFDAEWIQIKEEQDLVQQIVRIKNYLSITKREQTAVVAVEEGFTHSQEGLVLTGTIDRIEQLQDGKYMIVDLKTGKTLPSLKDMGDHLQLKSYQFAIHQKLFDNIEPERLIGAKLLAVAKEKGKNSPQLAYEFPQAALEPDQIHIFAELLDETAAQMRKNSFTAPADEDIKHNFNAKTAHQQTLGRVSD